MTAYRNGTDAITARTGVLAVVTAAGVAAGALFVTTGLEQTELPAARATTPGTQVAIDAARYERILADKGLAPVELEPRFVAGTQGFATAAEVDAVLGQPVEPWQQFTYIGDAHVRQAIASPVYRGGDLEPDPELVTDGNGGVWRVLREVPRPQVRVPAEIGWTRKVWLLPAGASYRGEVSIAYPR